MEEMVGKITIDQKTRSVVYIPVWIGKIQKKNDTKIALFIF